MTAIASERRGYQAELFSASVPTRVETLSGPVGRLRSEALGELSELILGHEDHYPGIGRWLTKKVIPGLGTGERVGWVAYESEIPVAAAVLKKGVRAKFCHLSVTEAARDRGVGTLLFCQMALAARRHAKDIHFTLPEDLWLERTSFFAEFGFESAAVAGRQYRRSLPELACSAPIATVLKNAFSQLAGLPSRYRCGPFSLAADLVISVRPRFAERIVAGTKTVEFRRRFSPRMVGRRAAIYSCAPDKSIVGECTIKSVTIGTPGAIWERFGAAAGCTAEEFFGYTDGSANASAVELSDIKPYFAPLSLNQLEDITGQKLRPPQSYALLGRTASAKAWSSAISAAGMLHGSVLAPRPGEKPIFV